MNILIDIGHPAHVYYFKNFVKIMKKAGHVVTIIARDRDVIFQLLDKHEIRFYSRGKGGKGFLRKFLYLFKGDYKILNLALKIRPDIFLSYASPYAAHVSALLNKPHIAFDDNEHAKIERIMYEPFTKVILNPFFYKTDLGDKQIKFDGYLELCYLNRKYFTPDPNILKILKLKKDDKYVILRFVSWTASHDFRYAGLDLNQKIVLVNKIAEYAKVFISSEGPLEDELVKYKLDVPPNLLHHALFFSSLYIGEGATIAAECACLGTPSIYINPINVGDCEELEKKYGLVHHHTKIDDIINKALEILFLPDSKQSYSKKCIKMITEKIDVTAFMVWFVENYPGSAHIMKNDPQYQYRQFAQH